MKPIVIVGAGMGGLALALRLAHRGANVIVLERTEQVGGRNREQHVGGCHFDGGPTLMMMLEPFQRLFADVDESLEAHLSLTLCDPSYRVFFRDGLRIDASANMARMLRQLEAVSPGDAKGYPAFLGRLASLYHDSIPNFVRRNFDHPGHFFGPKQLALVLKHGMIGNLRKTVDRHFADERLRMLFSFQTMYLGLSPYDAPWVYSTLTYMEFGDGIWYPKGGVRRIGQVIGELAQKRGAEIRLNTTVARVDPGGVTLDSGERIDAAAVVCNADLPYARETLLGETIPSKWRYSCSGVVFMWSYRGKLPTMLHHNVFFGKDFKTNLDDIFQYKARPEDPAFYACISARSDPDQAPEGHENLFVLVPCANLDRPWNNEELAFFRNHVQQRLSEDVGFDPQCVEDEQVFSPEDWRQELNLAKGAAFGLSHDFWQSAYFRPDNRSRTSPNVFFVGASTAPGNGLPMVLISAENVEERLVKAHLVPLRN